MGDLKKYRNFFIDSFTYDNQENQELRTGASNINIIPPYGKNSTTILSILFEDRKYYKDFIIPFINGYFPEKVVFIDLLEKNSLYGLINNSLEPILTSEVFMKQIPSGNDKPQYLMDFVADAFNEMNIYLSNAVILGKLPKESLFYNLKGYSSYSNPDILIKQNQNKIVKQFINKTINDLHASSKIKDAKTFNDSFLQFLKECISRGYPITKAENVFNNNFKTFSSGLIVDIARDKADNDFIKYNKYMFQEDFLIFADACKRFGFLIDENVPWRIVADLNSPAMTNLTGNHNGYMRRYSLENVEDLINKRFSSVLYEEVHFLKDFFYNFYEYFISEYPYYQTDYKKLNVCDFNKQTIFRRESITRQKYELKFPNTYWLRVYTYLRNYEEGRGLNQTQFDNIVREANNYVKLGNLESGIAFVNEYFKQFKKVNYLSSLLNQENVVEMKATNVSMPQLIF